MHLIKLLYTINRIQAMSFVKIVFTYSAIDCMSETDKNTGQLYYSGYIFKPNRRVCI